MADKAIAELKEAEQLEPQGIALANLELLAGSTYHLLDKRVEAIEHYERFVTLWKKTGGDASTATKWSARSVNCGLP